jgi:uncharacterized DUF497 family protein
VKFEWDATKNEKLMAERGIGFAEVVAAYNSGNFCVIDLHPNQAKHPGQYMMVIAIADYLCRVPFVWKNRDTAFLKTIYPSRKEMKRWLRK